jgi:predicted patatin/cPLA2 family phospholipase
MEELNPYPSSGPEKLPFLHGVNPSAAIAAVKDRAARWLDGNRPRDGRKLGLVVEGGAMRGVCSAGGVMALAHLGFTDVFDEVYATTAGAMNASYFLSDQVKLGITIYFDNCTTRLFLNPLRVWRILDIDYLFDRVISSDKRLDVDRINTSTTKFFVSAIDRSTGEGLVIDCKKANAPLLQVLKAATAVPRLYNRSIDVDGRALIDGGLINPFPIQRALANGCTDLVVLLIRPANFRHGKPGWLEKRLFNLMCARGNADLGHAYALCDEWSHIVRDLALGKSPTPWISSRG